MKYKICFLTFSCLLFLSSCWDQRLLKEAKVVYGFGGDLEKDGNMLLTAVIRTNSQSSKGTRQPESTNVIVQAVAPTLSDSRTKISRKISGDYAVSKTRLLLFSNEMAKEDIYPVLDIIYRDPRSSLGAKVVVSKGRSDEILKLKMIEETLISEEILKIITTAETYTIVPNENVQSICPTIFDPGEDIALPLVEKTKDNMIDVTGVALFNGRKYTGYNITEEDPTLLLLLKDQMKKFAKFTLNVNPKEKDMRNKFVSIDVKKSKIKKELKISKNNDITLDIKLNLKVETLEYPKDELSKKKVINRLNEEISKQLTAKARKIIQTLQEANCDFFGIGRDLIAFHPKVWKQIDWMKTYPKIKINPVVKVEVVGTGIIE